MATDIKNACQPSLKDGLCMRQAGYSGHWPEKDLLLKRGASSSTGLCGNHDCEKISRVMSNV